MKPALSPAARTRQHAPRHSAAVAGQPAIWPTAGPKPGPATRPRSLVERTGSLYSKQLGIDLDADDPAENFKWFLAALLFGARISERGAIRTWREFESAGLLTPKEIVDAGWDRLVQVLDRGGYARYDYKTATKLLDICGTLRERYAGDLNALHAASSDEAQLEQRLRELGKGIGDVTVNIFLREMRGRWKAAAPLPSSRVIQAAKALRFVSGRLQAPASVLQALQAAWERDGGTPETFPEFEAALVRIGARRKSFALPPGIRSGPPARLGRRKTPEGPGQV